MAAAAGEGAAPGNDEPLAATLQRLPDDDRNLIRWHYDEGLTIAEIGLRLCCWERAAQQRRLKILERLRRAVDPPGQ